MKKILILVLTILAMTAIFCVTAFAAESGPVMKVQYGSETKEFNVFDDGWNFAMETAGSGKEVTVTLLKDWSATDGPFTDDFSNGAGFDYDAIYFAVDVKMIFDLNGHTIDRGLVAPEMNGEVMFINDDATVTIKNGTIKGGYSNNGAGGIHIENANVTLIDLVFTGNRVRDDDGAAIQHTDGGKLHMKNCSFVSNEGSKSGIASYGTVFLADVDSVLIEDCRFKNNVRLSYGAGIYATSVRDLQIKNTTFEGHRATQRGGAIWVGGESSALYLYNCLFKDNSSDVGQQSSNIFGHYGGAIYADQATLYVYDCTFSGNYARWDGGAVYFNNVNNAIFERCTFDDNTGGWDGGAFFVNSNSSVSVYGCTFTNNKATETGGAIYLDFSSYVFLYSDDENQKPTIIKNNKAGEIGGGIYQVKDRAILALEGEIYVKENVSALGQDDIYVEAFNNVYVGKISSPEASIGIRCTEEASGSVVKPDSAENSSSVAAFFSNVEGLEIRFSESQSFSKLQMYMHMTDFGENTPDKIGSIFGDGSLTTIVAFAALIASIASIGVQIASNKKKNAPATTDNEE